MLYDKDGNLDLEAAARKATEIGGVRNRDIRAGLSAELTIAALLDIAGSLRVLALEVLEARGLTEEYPPSVDPFADDRGAPRARTLAEHIARGEPVDGWLMPGDVVGFGEGVPGQAYVVDVGVSEGEPWAALVFDEGVDDPAVRGWQRDLELAVVGIATEAEAPALRAEDDGDGEEPVGGYELDEPETAPVVAVDREDLVDDIDDDFDGDTHNAAADAVAQLAANEAARKAKKKGGKK